jgi:hypothetical protein
MDKDRKESSKKRKTSRAPLHLVADPRRETKALQATAAGGSEPRAVAAKATTAAEVMPPPAAPAVLVATVSSLAKAA